MTSLSKSTKPKATAKRQRVFCKRCNRPEERTCICSALPDTPVRLHRCHAVVLQHPLEAKRKNRSLPLAQLCLDTSSISISIQRRFGNETDPKILERLQNENQPVWLFYPDENSISLSDAVRNLSTNSTSNPESIVTVMFLDATWSYAREMNIANEQTGQYPHNLQRVKLTKEDFDVFKPRRFDIRTPPSENCLSTAECLAFSVAKIEGRPSIYDSIMQPLDLMVEQWHSFSEKRKGGTKRIKLLADDDKKPE